MSLRIANQQYDRPIPDLAASVAFDVELEQGKTTMQSTFTNDAGLERGAYFAYVERLTDGA